tara:strand:+ start:474 stop:662 length:189 start_codon:yes stop_codon:yes gene_type:complete
MYDKPENIKEAHVPKPYIPHDIKQSHTKTVMNIHNNKVLFNGQQQDKETINDWIKGQLGFSS